MPNSFCNLRTTDVGFSLVFTSSDSVLPFIVVPSLQVIVGVPFGNGFFLGFISVQPAFLYMSSLLIGIFLTFLTPFTIPTTFVVLPVNLSPTALNLSCTCPMVVLPPPASV